MKPAIAKVAEIWRQILALGLAGFLLLGSGCTTVRCYDIETVSDEQSQDESTNSEQF